MTEARRSMASDQERLFVHAQRQPEYLSLFLLSLLACPCTCGGRASGDKHRGASAMGTHTQPARGEGKVPAHTCTQNTLAESGGGLGSQLDDPQAMLRASRSG